VEIIIFIIATIIIFLGLIGCIAPVIPGPPLCYIAVLLIHFFTTLSFTPIFLWLGAILTITVTLLDLWFQIYGVKKFGGSKKAILGTTIGLIIGFFFAPIGLIIGPFLGAFIGEILNSSNQKIKKPFTVAIGALFGFIAGSLLKISIGVYISYHFFYKIIDSLFI